MLLARKLDELLIENISDTQKREASTFNQLAGSDTPDLIFFGSGDLGRRTLAGAQKLGLNVLGFADNNPKLWNTEVEGLPVFKPEEAIEKFPDAVFVLTIWSHSVGHPIHEVHEQLNKQGKVKLVSFIFLYWKYPHIFLPYWRCDLPHKTIDQFELVAAALNLWSDEASQQEYVAEITWRLLGDFKNLGSPVKHKQYFPTDIFDLNEKEVFIDIGAFDGDTLRDFLESSSNRFLHYHAFEPDPFGFDKLAEFVSGIPEDARKKIKIEFFGVGSHHEKIDIEAPGIYFKILYPNFTGPKSAEVKDGMVTVDSYALDELEFEHAPTFIKMDVEGFEPNVIFGAKKIIQKYTPIIAVSIYHKFDHIWKLPLAINALSNNYNFYLRPHFMTGWELVFYAVPKSRAKI